MAAVLYRRAAGESRLDAERSRLVERHVALADHRAHALPWGWRIPTTALGRALGPDARGTPVSARSRELRAGYSALRIEYTIRRGRLVRSGLSRSCGSTEAAPCLSRSTLRSRGWRSSCSTRYPAPTPTGTGGCGRWFAAPAARAVCRRAPLRPRPHPVRGRDRDRVQPDACLAHRTCRVGDAPRMGR